MSVLRWASLWAYHSVVVFCLGLSHEYLQFLVVRSPRPLGWLRPLLHELESCHLRPLLLVRMWTALCLFSSHPLSVGDCTYFLLGGTFVRWFIAKLARLGLVVETCCHFQMVGSPFNFVICSLWWTFIVRCNISWWLMTVFRAANWIKGIRGCAGVPIIITSNLCSTVSSCPGYLIVKVEPEVFTNAATSGISSYRPALELFLAACWSNCFPR